MNTCIYSRTKCTLTVNCGEWLSLILQALFMSYAATTLTKYTRKILSMLSIKHVINVAKCRPI